MGKKGKKNYHNSNVSTYFVISIFDGRWWYLKWSPDVQLCIVLYVNQSRIRSLRTIRNFVLSSFFVFSFLLVSFGHQLHHDMRRRKIRRGESIAKKSNIFFHGAGIIFSSRWKEVTTDELDSTLFISCRDNGQGGRVQTKNSCVRTCIQIKFYRIQKFRPKN